MVNLLTVYASALLDFLSVFISSDFGIVCIIGSVICLVVWRPLVSVLKL